MRELKLKKAAPAVTARLGLEATGFSGIGRRMLEDTLEALKDTEPKTAGSSSSAGARSIDELEKQAADLEKRARELREKIEALKVKPSTGKAAAAKAA